MRQTSPARTWRAHPLGLLAELGAAVLLFEAGLDSDPRELARAGIASFLVAIAGVLAPTLLGYAAARALLPGAGPLAIGVGMIPRGEVGLIFAGIGQQLVVQGKPLVDAGVTSALVVVMLVTTVVTPPALRMVFARGARRAAEAANRSGGHGQQA